ncbi:hypothetical protein [Novipirellula maiorica]|nr:hypothetical protein [Rhodopirellula maiorica]
MGLPGPFEILVIAAILACLVGLPLAIVVLVILLTKRNDRDRHQDNEHHE